MSKLMLITPLILALGCSRPASEPAADMPVEIDEVDRPGEDVENALGTYCEKNDIRRDEVEPFALDLVPGTRTFRHALPPLEAPASSPYAGLPARHAYLLVDAKSGNLIEIKAAEYGYSILGSTGELFAAMRAAGVRVRTAADATKVMRTLLLLERAARQATARPEDLDRIQGRLFRDGEFDGGAFGWTGGDRVGLLVDGDGFATALTGGHLK